MKLLGVLAGTDSTELLLRQWANSADRILAADGGCDRLLEFGFEPDLTIGDLDSISDHARDSQQNVIHDPNQDSSDADKLLRLAEDEGASRITLVGIEGDLLDHTLGALSSAVRSRLNVRIALRRGMAWVLKGGDSVEVSITPGARVSLLPLNPCQGVEMAGVKWPLHRADLDTTGLISLSNQSDSDTVWAHVGSGCAFLFVERDHAVPDWLTWQRNG